MTAFGSVQPAARAQPADAREQERIRDVLSRLARPRLTGSPGAAETESYLRGEFEGLGYEVRELPFTFSTLPGRLGVPALGALFGIGGALAAALAGAHEGVAALAVLAVVAVLLATGAGQARRAIAHLKWGRLQTANWLVARPGARPCYLVMAHRDSKSQGVPLLLRAGAVGAGLAASLALLLLALVSYAGPATWNLGFGAWTIGLVCLAVGIVLALTYVRNDSPGALDNATGLATVLGLAARERGNGDVGFLITDGEELGLAGASAASRRLPTGLRIINVDGLDDVGDFFIVERYGVPPRGMAPQLVAALLAGAQALDAPARRRTLPLGVLVDHIPFAEAGFQAVTLMRGTAASLRRVHLPQDDASRLTGAGVAEGVALIAAALAVLRQGAVRV